MSMCVPLTTHCITAHGLFYSWCNSHAIRRDPTFVLCNCLQSVKKDMVAMQTSDMGVLKVYGLTFWGEEKKL